MFSKTNQKNFLKRIVSFTIAFVMMLFSMVSSKPYSAEAAATSVSQLKIVGTQLSDSNNNPIQLKGMSSHGLQWFGDYMNHDSMKYLRDNWGTNVVRAAMYTDEGGYISNPNGLKSKVKQIVDDAIDLNMYVIIDWHVLNDHDPNKYKTQAKSFFEEMARTYGNTPNVIYEICNEPNSGADWSNSIKPYADYIIPAIRAIDPDNIIIVGTSTWSQDVDIAANDQLSYSNIMYACHFYAGSHGQFLRDKINTALSKGAPIFVTEWGTSDASGNGGPFLNESQQWIDFMNEKKISWCNWSLCDKGEASAALKPGASKNGNWSDSDLSTSGLFVKKNSNTNNSNNNTNKPIVAAKVNTPSFNVAAGTYNSAQNVTLNCSTNGAAIHYTTDGTNPTASSPVYTNAINVSKNTTIKAIAVKNGMTDSDVASAYYSIVNNNNTSKPSVDDNNNNNNNTSKPSVDNNNNNNNTSKPSVDDNNNNNNNTSKPSTDNIYTSNSNVEVTYDTVSDWGAGANVQVTIKNNSSTPVNGWKLDWTQPSNMSINNMWSASYSKTGTTVTVKNCDYNGSIAANGGSITFGFIMNYSGLNVKPADIKFNNTSCVVNNGSVNNGSNNNNNNTSNNTPAVTAKVAAPTFSVAQGTYNTAQNVSLNCSTNGASIHYTVDGSNPTSLSPLYTKAINVSKDTTIKAIAVKDGMKDSDAVSASYTIKTISQKPSVDNGDKNSAVEVTYNVVGDWGTGANVQVTVKNNGSTPINGWKLEWNQPSNMEINNLWSAVYSKNNSTVTAVNYDYNRVIAANGGTVTFGFTMNYSGSNVKPESIKLNNTPCVVKY